MYAFIFYIAVSEVYNKSSVIYNLIILSRFHYMELQKNVRNC
jgi:hypothetical protein